MPTHRIYYPEGKLSDEDKQGISADLTKYYTGVGLPKFYVMVLFFPVNTKNFYVGDEVRDNTVRVISLHLARTIGVAGVDQARVTHAIDSLQEIFGRYFTPHGLNWEFHLEQGHLEDWRMNGIVPPPAGSEGEKTWAKLNKAVPWK